MPSGTRWWPCLLLVMLRPTEAGEGRRFERIPGTASSEASQAAPAQPPPPIRREECLADVERVARGYRSDELETLLHPDFPNRSQLLDALRRSETSATRVDLRVESVESVAPGAWRVAGAGRLVADCVADVRFRLSFDAGGTGRRPVSEVGRAQWVIRYEAPAAGTGDAR